MALKAPAGQQTKVLLQSVLAAAMTLMGACAAPDESEGPSDTATCEGNARVCDNDRVCGGGRCEIPDGESTGCCVQLRCFADTDCSDGNICDVRRGLCINPNLCDPGTQDKCPDGQLCTYVDGAPICTATPPEATSCAVATGGRQIDNGSGELSAAVLTAASTLQLEAVGYTAGDEIAPHASFTWSGDGVSASGVLTGACAGPAPCEVTVTATSGAATCDGVVRVYPALSANQSRIVVLDLLSGAPLTGITVSADTGAGAESATTDDNGAAVFEGTAVSLSAFPATHQWHTIIDPPNDVVIYTAQLPDTTKVAGLKGNFDFSKVSTDGDIKLGLAGTAINAAITDLDFANIVGEIGDYNVELEGFTDEGGELVPLPSGLVLGLGADDIKGDYVTFGTPGPNIAWAIGGQVELAKIGSLVADLTPGDGEDINPGAVLAAVLPFFATFDHAVKTDIAPLELQTRPEAPADGSPVPYAEWDFEEATLQPNTLLSRSANYTLPNLPCVSGRGESPNCTLAADAPAGASPFVSGAILLAGTIVPGYGLVPLGITAGLDDFSADDGDDFDGKLSYDSAVIGAPDDGDAILDYAPAHDGLEGKLMVSVAIALDVNSIASDTSSIGASIVTHVTPAYAANNTFPSGSFLEAQGGTYVAGQSFAMSPVGDADFYRVNLDNGEDQEWNVWFGDANTTFDIADLHPADLDVSARTLHADVQAFKLGTGYEAVGPAAGSFDELFAFNGTNLDNMLYYLGAWSSEACRDGGLCDE